jgi:hypothetical protein
MHDRAARRGGRVERRQGVEERQEELAQQLRVEATRREERGERLTARGGRGEEGHLEAVDGERAGVEDGEERSAVPRGEEERLLAEGLDEARLGEEVQVEETDGARLVEGGVEAVREREETGALRCLAYLGRGGGVAAGAERGVEAQELIAGGHWRRKRSDLGAFEKVSWQRPALVANLKKQLRICYWLSWLS